MKEELNNTLKEIGIPIPTNFEVGFIENFFDELEPTFINLSIKNHRILLSSSPKFWRFLIYIVYSFKELIRETYETYDIEYIETPVFLSKRKIEDWREMTDEIRIFNEIGISIEIEIILNSEISPYIENIVFFFHEELH